MTADGDGDGGERNIVQIAATPGTPGGDAPF